jgi:hypothetical protein
MAKKRIRKPALGIDQLSDETSLVSDDERRVSAAREVTNADLDEEGNVSRRQGYTNKLSGEGYHSLYSSRRGLLMVCHKDELGIYDPPSGTFTALTSMSEASLTSFTEMNGNMYFTNPGYAGMLRPENLNVRPLGVPLPNTTVAFAAISNGALPAGSYGVTYSIVDELGEESYLAPLEVVEITTDRGGIQGTAFTIISGYTYRVYMTTTDGEELYQAAEFDADSVAVSIYDHEEGRQPSTQFLEQLPYGYIIRAHGSRLYVATTGFVFYSQPFMPHLTNPAHDFLPTTGFTTMLQPVDTGIYIADKTGVKFYRGDDPSQFEPKDVSDEPVVFNTAVSVPGDFLPAELGSNDTAAIWLAPSGYQVGLPSGEVIRLHSKQVKLPSYVQGCAAVSVEDGRKQLITPVNSNVLADAGVALDSTIS